MSEKIKILSREDLYNLVWSKPLTTLAKDYAYSDNGMRKICIKHNIPLPKSGYWSKMKFNKKVRKETLPKGDDNIITELLTQVFQFSRLYWKSLRQQNVPITIKYPEMVAQIAPRFNNGVPDDAKDALWFL